MQIYKLRLYKRLPTHKNLHQVVDQYGIEATNDDDAKVKAQALEIPSFDDSDFAVLYGANGAVIWRKDR